MPKNKEYEIKYHQKVCKVIKEHNQSYSKKSDKGSKTIWKSESRIVLVVGGNWDQICYPQISFLLPCGHILFLYSNALFHRWQLVILLNFSALFLFYFLPFSLFLLLITALFDFFSHFILLFLPVQFYYWREICWRYILSIALELKKTHLKADSKEVLDK